MTASTLALVVAALAVGWCAFFLLAAVLVRGWPWVCDAARSAWSSSSPVRAWRRWRLRDGVIGMRVEARTARFPAGDGRPW